MVDFSVITGLKIIEWGGAIVVVAALFLYGKRLIRWLLLKCYSFFIGSKDHAAPV